MMRSQRVGLAILLLLCTAGCHQGTNPSAPSTSGLSTDSAARSVAQVAPVAARARCETPTPSTEDLAAARIAVSAFREANASRMATLNSVLITVPIAFHVILSGDGTRGDVSDAVIDKQLDVLNSCYKDRGMQFTKYGVDRTRHDEWFTVRMDTTAERLNKLDTPERRMKRKLGVRPQEI